MIELVKIYKCSLLLKISKDNASLLYDYLDNLDKNSMSILFKGKEIDFEIIVDELDISLIMNNKSIKIYMDDEEVQFFKYRINEAIEGRGFFPAELCDRKMKNKTISIYCIVE